MAETKKKRQAKQKNKPGAGTYDDWVNWQAMYQDARMHGKVVLRSEETVWEQSRHALLRQYLTPLNEDELAVPGWLVFIQELRTHSGKHRHQGGICLFVLDGKGHTIVDGVRYDWEGGDCIFLPVKPGGVEHQHFNDNPDGPSRWMHFGYLPLHLILGTGTEQIELHPDWKGKVTFKEASDEASY